MYSIEDLAKVNQGAVYEMEAKRYELIRSLSAQKYLDGFFERLAVKELKSPEKAREDYIEKRARPSEPEIKKAIAQYRDHPSLKGLKESERDRQITQYLVQTKTQELLSELIEDAQKKNGLEILYPEPKEPIYDVGVSSTDHVRYSLNPGANDAPCEGDSCPITIVEYSDFQCPYCSQVQDASRQVLEDYKGKIRWIVRDYLLPFHERARPAAIAAHCAGEQGKYWPMYDIFFRNQKKLGDTDIKAYASQIGLDSKAFEACLQQPDKALARLEKNAKGAASFGVTGTPTFFINGRRMSGKIPVEEFKRAIDSSLKK